MIDRETPAPVTALGVEADCDREWAQTAAAVYARRPVVDVHESIAAMLALLGAQAGETVRDAAARVVAERDAQVTR